MVRWLSLSVAVGAILSWSASAQAPATFVTGNALYEWCKSPQLDACRGYIIGVFDAVAWHGGAGICRPSGATVEQLTDVVRKDMESRPALFGRYDCDGGSQGGVAL